MKGSGKTAFFYLGLLLIACLNYGDSNIPVVESSLDLQQEVLQGPTEEPDNLDLDNPGSVAGVNEAPDDRAAVSSPAAHSAPLFTTRHASLRPIRAPPIA